MAKTLVAQMSSKWEPDRYRDEYAEAVMKLVHKKIKAGGKELPTHKKTAPTATNVVDLVKVLQESLAATGKSAAKKPAPAAKSSRKRTSHKHAA